MSATETIGGFAHRFVPGTRRDLPPLLLLHGTGGNEDDLLELGREIAPDAALLSPRGKVLENGAPRFFRRLAEGVFDLDDVRSRAGELAAFVECAVEEYGLAGARVVAAGYSNGANIAAATMLLHPGRIHAAALLRAMVVLEPSPLPDLSGAAIFMASGVLDPIVPDSHVTRLANIFRRAGASVELKRQQASHGLVQSDIFDSREWLARIVQR
jgi:phospholipase/carboxylesterase